MIHDTTLVEVRNLMDYQVRYLIKNTNVRRIFQPNQTIKVPAGELRQLNYEKGGRSLLLNRLSVQNKELAAEFGIDLDEAVEYSWTKEDIDRVLEKGSLEELEDAMDFAPEGIKERLAERAVQLSINDSNKRKVITENTAYDIDAQIKNKELMENAGPAPAPEQPKRRRVTKTEG